jgi:small basic protein
MILLPVVALVIGVLLALAFGEPVRGMQGQYLAVACLAGLDSLCGGVRSGLEGKFHTDVFVTGFVSNILIAFFLAWLGDKIFIDTFLAVALVLGARIFTNLSLIRRYLLTKWHDARERKRLQLMAQAAQAQIQPEANP